MNFNIITPKSFIPSYKTNLLKRPPKRRLSISINRIVSNVGLSYITGSATGIVIGSGIGIFSSRKYPTLKLKVNKILNEILENRENFSQLFAVTTTMYYVFNGFTILSRKKDDGFSYILAGTAAGIVSGLSNSQTMTRSILVGSGIGIVTAIYKKIQYPNLKWYQSYKNVR